MFKRRTPQQEMAAWKRRVELLLKKEARCPSCQRCREKYEGTNIPRICNRHREIRVSMALTFKRRYWNG